MATVNEIDALLPQTQCGECNYKGCRPYAEALVQGQIGIDRCPPGGVATLKTLGVALSIDPKPYLRTMDERTRLPSIAVISEAECIGCTKCITACPVDAILGSGKMLHSVIAHECTGCGLCVEPCPVDCIDMVPIAEPDYDKDRARTRFHAKQTRLLRIQHEKQQQYRQKRQLESRTTPQAQEIQAKQSYIQEALARVKAKKNHE